MMGKVKKTGFVFKPKIANAKTPVLSSKSTNNESWRKSQMSDKNQINKHIADQTHGTQGHKISSEISKKKSHSHVQVADKLSITAVNGKKVTSLATSNLKTKLHPRGHHVKCKKQNKKSKQRLGSTSQGEHTVGMNADGRASLPSNFHTSQTVAGKDMQAKEVFSSSQEGNTAPAHRQHRKRKKALGKKHDGTSNWMKLCSELKINTGVRKTKPVKRPVEEIADKAENSEPKRVKHDVWFDNVDKILIETETDRVAEDSRKGGAKGTVPDTSDALVKPDSFKGVTNCVAMDCEMVGVGPKGEESILARVSIVNHYGVCLYDKFVLPREKVTDYRTFVSGVTEENLATGEEFTKVQKEVSDIIKDRILVGHAVHNDLKVLFLTHPHKMIRDTSQYKPFRELFAGRIPSLKKLTDKVLGVTVQEGQHSSVQDAQATMRLYTMYRQRWEKELKGRRKTEKRKKKKKLKKMD